MYVFLCGVGAFVRLCVCVCVSVVMLCNEHRMLMRGHTKRLLRATAAAITDPSPVVGRAMAAAAAALCACAKEEQVEQYVDDLVRMYREVRYCYTYCTTPVPYLLPSCLYLVPAPSHRLCVFNWVFLIGNKPGGGRREEARCMRNGVARSH